MSESYPALIDLIGRLEGKDRKTCELALYCLNKADKREAKLRAKNERLRAALQPFADEASVGPMPGEPNDPRRCNMKFLCAAAAALKESVNE